MSNSQAFPYAIHTNSKRIDLQIIFIYSIDNRDIMDVDEAQRFIEKVCFVFNDFSYVICGYTNWYKYYWSHLGFLLNRDMMKLLKCVQTRKANVEKRMD